MLDSFSGTPVRSATVSLSHILSSIPPCNAVSSSVSPCSCLSKCLTACLMKLPIKSYRCIASQSFPRWPPPGLTPSHLSLPPGRQSYILSESGTAYAFLDVILSTSGWTNLVVCLDCQLIRRLGGVPRLCKLFSVRPRFHSL